MGLLDNVFKSFDETLKSLENGSLDKKINEIANYVENIGSKSEAAVKKLSEKTDGLGDKLDLAKREADKTMDVLRRKDSN